MALEDRKLWGEARRNLPNLQGEGSTGPLRSTRYGELAVTGVGKALYALADEGNYYMATNPTPGTGIAGIAATGAFSDAESTLYVRNGNTDASNVRVYLDYLRVTVTAAGTAGADHRYVSKTDKGADRYTSGGSTITSVNVNMDSVRTPGAVVRFGALVTTAASSDARLLSNGLIRNVITVAGDVYQWDFGGDQHPIISHAVAGTAIANIVMKHPPVVLGPTQMFVMSLHATSQTGATSYEFELGYYER